MTGVIIILQVLLEPLLSIYCKLQEEEKDLMNIEKKEYVSCFPVTVILS